MGSRKVSYAAFEEAEDDVTNEVVPSSTPLASHQELNTMEMLRYIQRRPHTLFARKAKMLILSIALCHTCLPEHSATGEISFQASSPDELALVVAAQELGYLSYERNAAILTVQTFPDGPTAQPVYEDYEVLDVIEFSSKRKRMSVVVRFPDKRICVMCKGADSIVMERLRLASLAAQKVIEIEKRASDRKSMEAQNAIARQSSQIERSGSIASFARRSSSVRPSLLKRTSTGRVVPIRDEVDMWLNERERDVEIDAASANSVYYTPRPSGQFSRRSSFAGPDHRASMQSQREDEELVEEALVADDPAIIERCFQHVNDFATEGLRTLLYGHRFLNENEYQSWRKIYHDATTSLVNRSELIEKAGELIEQQLELGGATAIEDKLQKGVPETIERLRRAGIKMWMLTGDKRETAINIGHSCRLIKDYSSVTVIDQEAGNIEHTMAAAVSAIQGGGVAHSVVVVDGQTLASITASDAWNTSFLELAILADSVICCRASPSQKASLVHSIRKRVGGSVTLAIGDGANDIAMIQEAHVGIGITGKEGLQAARVSDYSIAQFRFLRKLLLVHGAWSYQRISKVILYFYYKNTALFITQFWYSFQNAFSGQVIVESWTLSFFNVAFTVLPPFVLGIFDQFVNARLLDRYPQLYQLTQKGVFFRRHNFWSWVGNGFYHSLILYYGSILIYWDDAPLGDGTTAGHWVWGTAMYTAGLVTVLAKAALITNIWTKYTVIAIPGSMAIWFIFLPIYAFVAPKLNFSTEYVNTLPIIMSSPRYWLTIIALPAVCLIRDFAWKYAKRMYYPQTYHHVQEIQKYNIQDYRPRYVTDLYIYNSDYYQMIAHALRTSLTHSQNGAIPEGDPQSPPSTAHAQTARLRFLANGRESSACLAGLRYNKGARKVRRDDKQSSMMKVAVKGQIERLVCFLVRQQLVDRAERSWWHEILGCERLYLGMCVWRLASEKVGLLYLVSADDLHEGDFVSRSIV